MSNSVAVASNEDLRRLNDATDYCNKIIERWNNRITLERVSFVEAYIIGRFSIICDVRLLDVRNGVNDCRVGLTASLSNEKTKVLENDSTCSCAHSSNAYIGNNGNQELMFVHNVKIVKTAKRIIPSTVRLYAIKNEIGDERKHLFYSTVEGVFKFLSSIPKGKLCPSCETTTKGRNHVANQNVESSPNVMNGIAKNERYLFWKRLVRQLNFYITPASLGVGLRVDRKGLASKVVSKNRVEVLDVLVGPFNL